LNEGQYKTDGFSCEEFAMKTNLFSCVVGIALAVFGSSGVPAETQRPVSAERPEPYRIYDLGSRNVIKNPDYREPKRVKRTTKRAIRVTEPHRIYNPATQQFEDSREFREPISKRQ
jgi:hypothetical protein